MSNTELIAEAQATLAQHDRVWANTSNNPPTARGVSAALRKMIPALEAAEAERDAALAVIVAYKAAGDDVKRACAECEGEGVVLVDFHYGTVEIECTDCDATGVTP